MAAVTKPVEFNLPDNDVVALIPWAYVLERLGEDLPPIMTQLSIVNAGLKRIDDKLKEWNAENEEE